MTRIGQQWHDEIFPASKSEPAKHMAKLRARRRELRAQEGDEHRQAAQAREQLQALTEQIARQEAREVRRWAIERRGDLPSLRAMFNDARSADVVTSNPFAAMRLPQPRGRRDLAPDWLKARDVDEIADAALACHGDYGPVFAALVRFAAYSGMRPGELFALEYSDPDGDLIHVRRAADSKTKTIGPPKNGKPRTIVLLPQAREAALSCPRLHDRLVFTAPRGGPLWQPNLSVLWKPVKCAAGRPAMDFYEFRHFCATYLLELGLSHADVALQLGHTDGGRLVMSTYGHPSEDQARRRILAATTSAADGSLVALSDRKAARGA